MGLEDVSRDIIGPAGQPEARICIDCDVAKPFDQFQRTPKGERAKDCKACRRAKYEKGIANKKAGEAPATKEWIIQEAQKLYMDQHTKLNDRIKLLDTISRNLSGEDKTPLGDAKVIRDLIASKKKLKALNGA